MGLAKRLNAACITACDECPQHTGFGGCEAGFGNVEKLHNRGISEVIRYWSDNNTIGGSLLLDFSYIECLDDEYKRIFIEAEDVIRKALEKAFG